MKPDVSPLVLFSNSNLRASKKSRVKLFWKNQLSSGIKLLLYNCVKARLVVAQNIITRVLLILVIFIRNLYRNRVFHIRPVGSVLSSFFITYVCRYLLQEKTGLRLLMIMFLPLTRPFNILVLLICSISTIL